MNKLTMFKNKMTDHKTYSLKQLENFLYDAMGAAEATPQEIYDVIKGVVEDNYYTYKHQTSNAYELLALLNGNGKGHIKDYDDTELMPYLQYTEEELIRDKDDTSKETLSDAISRGNQIHQAIDDCMRPWGHSDMEALQYTEQELDDMSAAAEAEAQEYAEAFVPKSYAVEVQHAYDKDGNELNAYITLPDEVIEHLGITDSSILDWNVNDDGNVIIKKHIWLN